jgi:hypothetical protein
MLLRLSTLFLALCPCAVAGTLYVDVNLTTGLNDGSSWDNAFQGVDGVRTALVAAVAGDEIYVAQGTYIPTTAGTRGTSFILQDGVEVYGGFLGGESSPAERPPFGAAPTVLSGDLNGNDGANQFGDNSYHPVRGGSAGASAVLDGFIVSGGNANVNGSNNDRGGGILCVNGASPTVRNCRFVGNRCSFGGGAGYVNGGAPSFTDCTFEDNFGGLYGGAFDIANAGAVRFDRCSFEGNSAARAGALEVFATSGFVVTNSVFRGNTATGTSGGGGLWFGSGGSGQVRCCTIVANSATAQAAGGLRVQGTNVTVADCILWANTGPGGAQGSTNQINGIGATYSIVEGGLAGTGNLASDPQFTDLAGGDFTLTLASPAIDAGSNAMVPAGVTLDRASSARFVDEPLVADTGAGSPPLVDIGAYERQAGIGTQDQNCTPTANSAGSVATLTATGSLVVLDNDLDLLVTGLPLNQFGYFLMSETTGSSPVSNGVLCLGAPQYRFNQDVLSSLGAGTMSFSPDLGNLPQGQVFGPGSTWYFQLWYRDGLRSNFSSSLCFAWQ